MVTIKTIAQQAGVSPSTVSIILNGKAKERKISPKTEKKVRDIIISTGYSPNVQAVGLRSIPKTFEYRIVIFWTADFRASMMTRFFSIIESKILDQNYSCEILLKPYQNNFLASAMTDDLIRSCHGLIICNSSEKDLEFLEQNSFSRPIVLYNRYSNKYSAVTVNDRFIGSIPADVFFSHNRKNPVIIASKPTFNGMILRTNLFSYQCTEHHMELPPVCYGPATLTGGYQTTLKALEEYPNCDCIFFSSDTLAIGALRAFQEKKRHIPQDLEFIAVGNHELEQGEICYPSISVMYIPIEEMAVQCLNLLYEQMTYRENTPQSISLPVRYIPRESCPDA